MNKRKYPMYWNLIPKPASQEAMYYFAMMNPDIREITDITSKIMEMLPPSNPTIINGKLDELNYEILVLETYNSKIEIPKIAKIYNGILIQDKNLYDRKKTSDGLEIYFCEKIKKLKEKKLI